MLKSILNFNLLVTTFRNREDDAFNELAELLEIFGDNNPSIKISSVSGVILGNTSLDPLHVVKNCKDLVRNEPWKFRYILRIIPLERTCATEITEIHNIVKQLCRKISHHETYKITVEKRHTKLRSDYIISMVTMDLDMKVNLDEPDWIILIQIINKIAGISIIRPNQIFSSAKEKIYTQQEDRI